MRAQPSHSTPLQDPKPRGCCWECCLSAPIRQELGQSGRTGPISGEAGHLQKLSSERGMSSLNSLLISGFSLCSEEVSWSFLLLMRSSFLPRSHVNPKGVNQHLGEHQTSVSQPRVVVFTNSTALVKLMLSHNETFYSTFNGDWAEAAAQQQPDRRLLRCEPNHQTNPDRNRPRCRDAGFQHWL